MDVTSNISPLIDNMADQALPRLLDIKKKVDAGAELNEADIKFMSQVSHYVQRSKRLIDRLPEWQAFYNEIFNLYLEIVDKALDNAEKPKPESRHQNNIL